MGYSGNNAAGGACLTLTSARREEAGAPWIVTSILFQIRSRSPKSPLLALKICAADVSNPPLSARAKNRCFYTPFDEVPLGEGFLAKKNLASYFLHQPCASDF